MSKEGTHRMRSQVDLHVSYPAGTTMAFIGSRSGDVLNFVPNSIDFFWLKINSMFNIFELFL
jgi:hypothetical protein